MCDANGTEITDTTHIGHINPIRYRGYYYDKEFGLYYLKSRYYDPAVGRFITQDDVDYADYEAIGGLNLYAYCNNNPVMHSDPSGFFAIPLAISLSGIVGCVILVVCLVVAAGSAIDKGNNTHVVSNAVKAAVEGIRDFTDNVKDFICAMVESLVVKKHYDDREKHHIVAKSDKRAGVSREILALVGIDINDEENLVSVKKEYHRVLHTNAYYLILNTGMVASYKFKGKEGVLQLLNFYKAILGGLS